MKCVSEIKTAVNPGGLDLKPNLLQTVREHFVVNSRGIRDIFDVYEVREILCCREILLFEGTGKKVG